MVALASRSSVEFVVGHGREDSTTIGPLINRAGLEKARDHCDDAIAKGATLLVGGTPLPEHGDNYFASLLFF